MTIKYHFFGKDCIIARDLFDRKNLEQAMKNQGFRASHTLFVNQIHSNEVVVVDSVEKIYGNQNLAKADAIVTNVPNVAIAVVTADCSPILFFDEEQKIIAVAHAGWRGAKSGVIANSVAAMRKLGAQEIRAVIGPMIQQNSYQVSAEFFADFIAEDQANSVFFVDCVEVDKKRFDLPAYVEKKLREVNVTKIHNVDVDTYTREQDFFSFRRSTHLDEKDCGRNVSVIEIV